MKTTKIAAIGIAAVLGLTSASMAQNMNPSNQAPSPGVSEVPVGGTSIDFDGLMTNLGSNAAVDFSTINDTTTIQVIKLSSLDASTMRGEELDAALQANASARSTWPTNLEGNASIKAALDAEGVAAGDVISVQTGADGSLILWVDDRM